MRNAPWMMLLLWGALPSCGTPAPTCPAVYITPIAVAVIDGASGLRICDATVFIRDGASNRSGTPSVGGTDASCGYDLNPHKTGTYTVSATAPGYQPAEAPNVHVDFDSCGIAASTQAVSVTLSRSP